MMETSVVTFVLLYKSLRYYYSNKVKVDKVVIIVVCVFQFDVADPDLSSQCKDLYYKLIVHRENVENNSNNYCSVAMLLRNRHLQNSSSPTAGSRYQAAGKV